MEAPNPPAQLCPSASIDYVSQQSLSYLIFIIILVSYHNKPADQVMGRKRLGTPDESFKSSDRVKKTLQ